MSAKVLSNLESLGELVGHLKGMSEGLEEETYIESIIQQAHGRAASAFDIAAAATGSAGHLPHVFEFGTAGITRGPVKFTDPTSPAARLWVHKMTGKGGQQDITYTFRPALNRNPQPTTASTGVPSRYLRKLSKRKYVFWNKAFVMETGQSVSIKSSRGSKGFLFVPTPGSNAPRNFVLFPSKTKGAITSVPGKDTKGTFTAFWMNWWAGAGNNIIEEDMRRSLDADLEKANAEMTKAAAAEAMKPVETIDIVGTTNKAKTKAKSLFGAMRKVKNYE